MAGAPDSVTTRDGPGETLDGPFKRGLLDEFVAAKVIMLATLLRRAQALRYQKLVGLALVESRMVTRIGASGPLSLNQLADHIGIGKSQSSRVVTNLVDRGLVRRLRNAANPREVELTLTPAGDEAFEVLLRAGAIRNEELTGGIPEDQLAVVHEVLATMIGRARTLLDADRRQHGDEGARSDEDLL
jgi:DNA-binding MarR family transcriptional regulator